MKFTIFSVLLTASLTVASLNVNASAVALNGKITNISVYTPVAPGKCGDGNCYGAPRLTLKITPKPHTNCSADFYLPISDPRVDLIKSLALSAIDNDTKMILSYDDEKHPEVGSKQECQIQGIELYY